MGRFYGEVGYATTVETAPGVWEEQIVTRNYYGDVLKLVNKYQSAEKVNDNFVVENRLSIVADPYAYEHFYAIRYVVWLGTKWKISSAEVQRPRLILTLGGVYNAQ